MGGACGTIKKRKIRTVLGWGNLKARNNLQDLGIYGKIILKRILQYSE